MSRLNVFDVRLTFHQLETEGKEETEAPFAPATSLPRVPSVSDQVLLDGEDPPFLFDNASKAFFPLDISPPLPPGGALTRDDGILIFRRA